MKHKTEGALHTGLITIFTEEPGHETDRLITPLNPLIDFPREEKL